MNWDASAVFNQNDGEVTKAFYAHLDSLGPRGKVATALFRAQKRSTAAKSYRRGKWRRSAYDVKNWSMDQVCTLLAAHAEELGIKWGWKTDHAQEYHNWVLYVDLPMVGQCSFHSSERGRKGPDYEGEWDRSGVSADRIIRFANETLGVLATQPAIPEEVLLAEMAFGLYSAEAFKVRKKYSDLLK